MYWIGFRTFKFASVIVLICLLFACGESTSDEQKEKKEKESSLSWEDQITRKIENELSINAKENYTIEFYYAYLNTDTIKDAVVLVNRKDYAFDYIGKSKSKSFFERMGYTAPYNYIFVVDGRGTKLVTTQPIGANVNYKLAIDFLKLTSSAQQDFYVEYRIKNSLFRNYYTFRGKSLYETFSCPVFDQIGKETPIVYEIEYPSSPLRISKDIALYKGEIRGYDSTKIEDINNYFPEEIIKKDSLEVYFIFDEGKMKYITPMRPDSEN